MSLTQEEIEAVEKNRAPLAFEVDWERLDQINRRRSPLVLRRAATGAIVILAGVLGIVLGRLIPSKNGVVGPSTEILLASLTPVARGERGLTTGRPQPTPEGTFAVLPGSSYSLVIRSPRSGVATLLLLGPERIVVLPRSGQSPIRVPAGQPLVHGPLAAPRARSTALLIVADPDPTETVSKVVAQTQSGQISVAELAERIRAALAGAGRTWVAMSQVDVEPAHDPQP